MKKPLLLMSALAVVSVGTLVWADDDDCFVPMSKWQTREAVRSMAAEQGWSVRRVKIDDGCYEIKGHDQSGREIEVKINPETLAIVDFEYEDDDDDDRRRKHLNQNHKGTTGVTPVNPPDNGLFTPGNPPVVIVE